MKKITLFLTILLSSLFGFSQNLSQDISLQNFNNNETIPVSIQLNSYLTLTTTVSGVFEIYTTGNSTPLQTGLPFTSQITKDTSFTVTRNGGGNGVVTINITTLTTSIKDIETTQNFNIYPNPVVNTLNIDVDNYDGDFQVFDMSGKTLIKTTDKSIDVSKLNSGNYILRFGTTTKMFKKE
jgi:hypothetical protein